MNDKNIVSTKNITLVLPIIFSFFYFFARGVSSFSLHAACLIGLFLVLFSNNGLFDSKPILANWTKTIVLMLMLLFASILLYLLSEVSVSYFDSPYSIVLSAIPFLIFIKKLDKEELLIFVLILLFIMTGILSYWVGGQSEYGSRVITSRYYKLLYFAPLLLAFKWMCSDWKLFLAASIVGVLGASVVALITFFYFDLANTALVDEFVFQHHVSGNTNPIFYGLIVLCLAIFVLLAIGFNLLEDKYNRILMLMLGLGLMCVLMSKSRGVWVALIAVLFAGMIIFFCSRKITRKRKLGVAVIMLLFCSASYNLPIVEERMNLMFSDFESYKNVETSVDVENANSVGARLELWKVAFSIFTKNIAFGVGPGGFRPELKKLAQDEKLNPNFSNFNQAHSQYFHTLATKGLVGMTVLIVFYTILIWVPLKRFVSFNDANKYDKYLAACCIAIVFCYAVLGLTESPFERRSSIVFFIYFYTLSFAAMKYSEVKHVEIMDSH